MANARSEAELSAEVTNVGQASIRPGQRDDSRVRRVRALLCPAGSRALQAARAGRGGVAADGSWRSPDFTIEDDTTGMTVYWENLGMLQRPSYNRTKLEWYRANGVVQHAHGGGANGVLATTEDGPDGSISSADIEDLVDGLRG